MESQELSLAFYGERLKTPHGQITHGMRLLAWVSLRFEADGGGSGTSPTVGGGSGGETPIRAHHITKKWK